MLTSIAAQHLAGLRGHKLAGFAVLRNSLFRQLTLVQPEVQSLITQWPDGTARGLLGKTSESVPTYTLWASGRFGKLLTRIQGDRL